MFFPQLKILGTREGVQSGTGKHFPGCRCQEYTVADNGGSLEESLAAADGFKSSTIHGIENPVDKYRLLYRF